MIRQVLSNFPYALMPTAVMLLFLLFFISVVIWVYRKGSTEFYGQIEQLPLQEDGER
jgi:cbb3-type cytochrome oxidase subunit 3